MACVRSGKMCYWPPIYFIERDFIAIWLIRSTFEFLFWRAARSQQASEIDAWVASGDSPDRTALAPEKIGKRKHDANSLILRLACLG